jgi:hypothetical protein
MLDLAELGDNSRVDLTVGDIYGGNYDKFGLKASTIASSFGKAIMWNSAETLNLPKPAFSAENSPSRTGKKSGRGRNAERDVAGPRSTSADFHRHSPVLEDGSFSSIGGKGVRRSDTTALPAAGSLRINAAAKSHSGPSRRHTADKLSGLGASHESDSSQESSPQLLSPAEQDSDFATPLAPSLRSPDLFKEESIDHRVSLSSWPLSQPPAETSLIPDVTHESKAPSPSNKYEAKDISRALLITISNNIGQLAYLNAVRYKCQQVFFAGNFLRHENTVAMRTLAYAISFWSEGSMEGLFLRHEGYCGALGAFLSTLETAEETLANEEHDGVPAA